jgi:hypothetical protein
MSGGSSVSMALLHEHVFRKSSCVTKQAAEQYIQQGHSHHDTLV